VKKRFTDEQIILMLKEQEAGERTADVCRRRGISQATFYKYKSRYGGMEPSDAKVLSDGCEPVSTRTVTRPLCRAKLTPLSESGGTVELKIDTGV